MRKPDSAFSIDPGSNSRIGHRPRSPISTSAVSQQIADWIRERIVQRQLRPGVRLREAQIAQTLRTSRTPVREAITQLIHEGLVTKQPNQSPRVVEFTDPMLEEIRTLRSALEGFAARLALERLNEKALGMLADIVEGMDQAARENSASRILKLDYAFHDAVLQAAGHQLLYELWSRMHGHIRLLISSRNIEQSDLLYTAGYHRKIFGALQKRDPELLQTLMGWPSRCSIERDGRPRKRRKARSSAIDGNATIVRSGRRTTGAARHGLARSPAKKDAGP